MIIKKEAMKDYYDEGYTHGYMDGYYNAKLDCAEKLNKIRAEIAEHKDDKIIHFERNEMIDTVLEIIDKYTGETE